MDLDLQTLRHASNFLPGRQDKHRNCSRAEIFATLGVVLLPRALAPQLPPATLAALPSPRAAQPMPTGDKVVTDTGRAAAQPGLSNPAGHPF